MSFKAKIENFWYYYKSAVILIGIVVLAGILLLNEFTKTVPSDLKVSLISAGTLSEGNINFNESLPGVIEDIDASGDANITIARLFLSESMKEDNAEAMRQSLESQLANKGATLFLVDAINFERLVKKDAFCPLDELMDISGYGDRVFYRDGTPIALHLTGSKVLSDMEFLNDDLYALILFRRPGEENDPVCVAEYKNATKVLTELMKQNNPA